MMKKRVLLAFVLPLLLAACGQNSTTATQGASSPEAKVSTETPTPTIEMTGGKTFAQSLQEPGWIQTSEGYWERDTENGHETIFMGPNGAKHALMDRQQIQAEMLKTVSGTERQKMQARFEEQNAPLIRAMQVAQVTEKMRSQGVDQCTHNESIQRLDSGPGIKATAWIQCPQSGYYPSAGGESHSNYGDHQANPSQNSTSASAYTAMSGTQNCNAYIFDQASDFWGYTVGKQIRGAGCYGVTLYPM